MIQIFFLNIFEGIKHCYHDYKLGIEDIDESFGVVHTLQNFSDSIVSTVTTKKSVESQLRELLSMFEIEVQHLAFLQYQMFVDYGVLIRGAVSYGYIYHEDNILFGEGMINAYEMESNLALFPRIIIDPRIIELIEEYAIKVGRFPDEIEDNKDSMFIPSLMYKQIRKDNDGLYFIDFLNLKDVGGYWYVPLHPNFQETFLHYKHKLIEKLNEIQNHSEKIKVKYNWLKEYYNSMVIKHCNCFPKNDITDALIDN